MAYAGSPDYKDFELAKSFKSEDFSDQATAMLALHSLRSARLQQAAANQAAVAAEVAAHKAAAKLPDDKRQAYFDEINACYGIGKVFLENPTTVSIVKDLGDFSDCVD